MRAVRARDKNALGQEARQENSDQSAIKIVEFRDLEMLVELVR